MKFPRLPAETQEKIVSEFEKKWSTLNLENERSEFIDRIFDDNNLRSTQR